MIYFIIYIVVVFLLFAYQFCEELNSNNEVDTLSYVLTLIWPIMVFFLGLCILAIWTKILWEAR